MPSLSYDTLTIGDGQTAAAEYASWIKGAVPSAQEAAHFEALREYCKLDTWAMVKLLEVLGEYGAGSVGRAGERKVENP